MDVVPVCPPTFERSSVVFCDKKHFVSSSLTFYESLLRQAATPFGILVTLDLAVPFTFSVLMCEIFCDNVFEAKLSLSPRSNFFQTTRQRSFKMNRWSLKWDVLSTRGKLVAKLQQLQLYGNTVVVRKSSTVADRTTTITTIWKLGFSVVGKLRQYSCWFLIWRKWLIRVGWTTIGTNSFENLWKTQIITYTVISVRLIIKHQSHKNLHEAVDFKFAVCYIIYFVNYIISHVILLYSLILKWL